MSATCPNCNSAVTDNAAACPRCHADFGKHSAWKPVVSGQARPASDPSSAFALAATLLALAAWAFVLLTSVSRSYQQTGNLDMFRWALSRALAGFGPNIALLALLLAGTAAVLSKGRKVPWTALVLGAALWLIALLLAR